MPNKSCSLAASGSSSSSCSFLPTETAFHLPSGSLPSSSCALNEIFRSNLAKKAPRGALPTTAVAAALSHTKIKHEKLSNQGGGWKINVFNTCSQPGQARPGCSPAAAASSQERKAKSVLFLYRPVPIGLYSCFGRSQNFTLLSPISHPTTKKPSDLAKFTRFSLFSLRFFCRLLCVLQFFRSLSRDVLRNISCCMLFSLLLLPVSLHSTQYPDGIYTLFSPLPGKS